MIKFRKIGMTRIIPSRICTRKILKISKEQEGRGRRAEHDARFLEKVMNKGKGGTRR